MPFGSGQFEFSEILQLQKSLCEEQLSSPLDRLMSEKLQLVNLANRTFGFNGWSYNITKQEIDYVIFDDAHKVAASCSLKVTLKDGTFREDSGYGTAEAANKGEAMERARRIALSKALKETLKAFGIIFQNFDVESERSSIHLQNPVSNFDNRNQNGQFDSGQCSNSPTSDGEEQNIPLHYSQLLASSSKKRQRNQFLEKTPINNQSKRFKTTLILNHSEKPLNKSGGFEETSAYKESSALAVEAHIPEQISLAVDEVLLEENGNENYNARLRSRKHLQNEFVHFADAEVASNLEYASETGPTPLKIKVEQEEDPTSISDPIPANKEVEIDNSPSELLSVKKYEILTSRSNRRKNKRLGLF